MKKIVLDSDIVIELSRNNARTVAAIEALSQKNVQFFYSPVVLAEVMAGMRPKEKAATLALFNSMECISISREIGEMAGEYLNRFHRSHGVEVADALIAASAVLENADLMTLNRKHYPMEEIRILK